MKTLKDVLQKAEHERFAVGHFNFSDLVAFNAIAEPPANCICR
jgi:fructose/tagatose bisphosphate aldolase